jgi:hypothetical protein
VPVEPKVFDLLAHLIAHLERVVGKDDMVAAVWGGRVVSESTLTSPPRCRARGGRRPGGASAAHQLKDRM